MAASCGDRLSAVVLAEPLELELPGMARREYRVAWDGFAYDKEQYAEFYGEEWYKDIWDAAHRRRFYYRRSFGIPQFHFPYMNPAFNSQ